MSADAPQTDPVPSGAATVESQDGNPAIPLRMRTNTAEIDSTIIHPGAVKINVKGAFIVDHDTEGSPNGNPNGGTHETKDIRLPNHTAVVSHIAVDVCHFFISVLLRICEDCLLIKLTDWRFFSKASILFSRTTLSRSWWTAELHNLRDGPDR